MFIKEGAIIPTQDVQDYVGQETVDHVTVDIFPSGRETSFRYYDDDGETYDYEDGVYFTQEISAQGTGKTEVTTPDWTTITWPSMARRLPRLPATGACPIMMTIMRC